MEHPVIPSNDQRMEVGSVPTNNQGELQSQVSSDAPDASDHAIDEDFVLDRSALSRKNAKVEKGVRPNLKNDEFMIKSDEIVMPEIHPAIHKVAKNSLM